MPESVSFPPEFPYAITVGEEMVYEPEIIPPEPVPPDPVPPDPVPPNTGPQPSGKPMPTVAPSNFPVTVMREDFNVTAAEGQFLTVYGPRNFGAYPTNYYDTRHNNISDFPENKMNYGTYDPGIISVPAGKGWMQLGLRTVNNSIRVAAPVPYVDPKNTANKWRDGRDLRVSICWKSDILDTRKVAWLLWPKTGSNTSGATQGAKDSSGHYIGGNGEIDFPEGDLNGSDNVTAFMHWQNGTKGSDQAVMSSTIKAAGSGWHVTTYEWMTGVSFKAWIDGVKIGEATGAKVPAEMMHLVLQTETILQTGTPLKSVTGNVFVDWITIETVQPKT